MLVAMTGLVSQAYISSGGFTVNGISYDSMNREWIVQVTPTGGQTVVGTITPEQTKALTGTSSSFPLAITLSSLETTVTYPIVNDKTPVYTYEFTRVDNCLPYRPICVDIASLGAQALYSCPSHPTYGAAVSQVKTNDFQTVCVYKKNFATTGHLDSPASMFAAKLKLTANGKAIEQTISSTQTSASFYSNGNILATAQWVGSLLTGNNPPQTFPYVAVAINPNGEWSVTKQSYYTDYTSSKMLTDSKLSQWTNNILSWPRTNTEVEAALSSHNAKVALLALTTAQITDGQYTYNYDATGTLTSTTPIVGVAYNRVIANPSITLRIKADWIGVIKALGTPSITNVQKTEFNSGSTGTALVTVKSLNEAGTYEASLVGCAPFTQITSGFTSRATIDSGASGVIAVGVNPGVLNAETSKTCSVEVRNVEDVTKKASAPLSIVFHTAQICTPGSQWVEGNAIMQCAGDGKTSSVVKMCTLGVNYVNGKFDCNVAPPPGNCDNDKVCDAGETTNSCPADCPPSVCDKDGVCDPNEDETCQDCGGDGCGYWVDFTLPNIGEFRVPDYACQFAAGTLKLIAFFAALVSGVTALALGVRHLPKYLGKKWGKNKWVVFALSLVIAVVLSSIVYYGVMM
jgi:hypothetical protein